VTEGPAALGDPEEAVADAPADTPDGD
jgi:hypothetical protein